MKTAARAASVGAGIVPGGRAVGAVELLEVRPVKDPEAWPGVVARVRSVKAGPVLAASGMANSDRPGPKAEGLEAGERMSGRPGSGDHLEERWGYRSKQVARLVEWSRERPPGLKRVGKSIEEPGPKPARPRRFHRGPASRQKLKK